MTNSPNQNLPPDSEAERTFESNDNLINPEEGFNRTTIILDDIDKYFGLGDYVDPHDTSIIDIIAQDPGLLQRITERYNAYAIEYELLRFEELSIEDRQYVVAQFIAFEEDTLKQKQKLALALLHRLIIDEIAKESIQALDESGTSMYSAKKMITIELLMNAEKYETLPRSALDAINAIIPGDELDTNPQSQEFAECQTVWVNNQVKLFNTGFLLDSIKSVIKDIFGKKLNALDIEIITAYLVTVTARQSIVTTEVHTANMQKIIAFLAEKEIPITLQALQTFVDTITVTLDADDND